MTKITENGFKVMTEAQQMLLSGNVSDGMTYLTLGLKQIKEDCSSNEWSEFSKTSFLQHPLTQVLHEDPFTRHSFEKPRGYAGDAELIDYMYNYRQPFSDTTELGRQIFDYTTNTPAPRSVRERQQIVANLIDELALSVDQPRLLSIACGHLREASLSKAVKENRIGEYIAFDQDPLSLELVNREFSQHNVRTVQSSIRALLNRKAKFDNLDFVYSAGLFDYLVQPVAKKLTHTMFKMLKPGGRMLVANFAPCLRDIGYLETFMQWNLIYRTEAEFLAVASDIPQSEIAAQRHYWDSVGSVIYLEITKK